MTEHPRPTDAGTEPVDPPQVSATRRALLVGGTLAGLFTVVPGLRAAAATRKTTRRTTKKTVKKVTKVPTTPAPAAPATSGATFDATQELIVSVTYKVQDSGFMVKNPYIAAFIVDASGALVRTVGISVLTTGKGLRYIDRLSEWNLLDQSRFAAGGADTLTTISSPTRMPSSWKWAWDGRDDKKNLVPKGDYLVVIEAAREHGPYSVIHEPVRFDGTTFVQKPADVNELVGATIELRAR